MLGDRTYEDMQARLEKLRMEAAKCAMIRDLARSPQKREFFTNLARQLDNLAAAVEHAIADGAADTSPGRRPMNPSPSRAAGRSPRFAARRGADAASNSSSPRPQADRDP